MAKIKKTQKDTSEWERYAGAQMEAMMDMVQTVIEQTADIPKLREDVNKMLAWEDKVNMIPAMLKQIAHMTTWEENVNKIPVIVEDVEQLKANTKAILEWESDVKLIPAIFEQTGRISEDLEILKEKEARTFQAN